MKMDKKSWFSYMGVVLILFATSCEDGRGRLLNKPVLILRPKKVINVYRDIGASRTIDEYFTIKHPIEFCHAASTPGMTEQELVAEVKAGYYSIALKESAVIKFVTDKSCGDLGFDTSVNRNFDHEFIRMKDLMSLPFDKNDISGYFFHERIKSQLKTYN